MEFIFPWRKKCDPSIGGYKQNKWQNRALPDLKKKIIATLPFEAPAQQPPLPN